MDHTTRELLVKVDHFEGPLDLLLHLIKEMKVDIYDIPMIAITDQYLAFIHSMQHMQLDIAGDYLVMAATLLEIKSRMLLPKKELISDDEFAYEEDTDLQAQLIQQLIEYKQFKDVSAVLKEKEEQRSQFFTKQASGLEQFQTAVPLSEGEVTTDDLISAFQRLLTKQKLRQPIAATIEGETFTVEESISTIRQRLRALPKQSGMPFNDLFDAGQKPQLIATFLAVLELARAREIYFEQSDLFEDIYIYHYEGRGGDA